MHTLSEHSFERLVQPMVTSSAGVNASRGLHCGVEPPDRCGTLSADPSPQPKHCEFFPVHFPGFSGTCSVIHCRNHVRCFNCAVL